MKIIAKKEKFIPTIMFYIILEIFFFITTIILFCLTIDIKMNILGLIISIFILSVPNVFIIGNIITGIKYYKSINIILEKDTLYLNQLLPTKIISKKEKAYNPYKFSRIGVYIPKKYKIDLKDIEEYGYKKDLNINNNLYQDRDIIIISNSKKYYIKTDDFNYKELIELINNIQKTIKLKPTGELKNLIVK